MNSSGLLCKAKHNIAQALDTQQHCTLRKPW